MINSLRCRLVNVIRERLQTVGPSGGLCLHSRNNGHLSLLGVISAMICWKCSDVCVSKREGGKSQALTKDEVPQGWCLDGRC